MYRNSQKTLESSLGKKTNERNIEAGLFCIEINHLKRYSLYIALSDMSTFPGAHGIVVDTTTFVMSSNCHSVCKSGPRGLLVYL